MNVKSELLSRLAKAEGKYISGSELAAELRVSRNAVWKAVKALEDEGFVIESVTAKGYRLSPDSNRISAELISAANSAEKLGCKMVILDETDSTNNAAKELAAQGAVHGTVVTADHQTSGKGRMGRKFVSPPGMGLYMSVVIRPEFSTFFAPLITSVAAVAAAEAVEKLCGREVQVKWVNDLYLNGKKICGILTEASLGLEANSLDYAVIGIGINVRRFDFGDELRDRVTSIEDETGIRVDRNILCAEVLARLEYWLGRIESRGHLDEYRRRELLTGNRITANVGLERIEGIALGTDENANLVVRLDDGSVRSLSSGEAELCRIVKK